MRKISGVSVAQFSTLMGLEALTAIAGAKYLVMPWVGEDFRGIAAVAAAILFFYMLAILAFRLIQVWAPVPCGSIAANSKGERRAFLYMLHYLLVFNPLIFNRAVPFPLLRVILRALGARMGENSYCAGIMMDPQFVTMGRDSIIGNGAMVISHVIEGDELGFFPVSIGDRVTIGAGAIIMADVEIGDGVVVAVQSVVTKGTRIPPGETWGGTPARCLRSAER